MRSYPVTQEHDTSMEVDMVGYKIVDKWIRIPSRGLEPHSGLSRAFIYGLIREGKIRSACLKKNGALRGVRTVNLSSLLGYLEKHATGGET